MDITRDQVNTAEKENYENVDQNTVGSVLSGALKSGSSQRQQQEKTKRASGVRFADQINKKTGKKILDGVQNSETSGGSSGAIKSRVAGMQVVGSQEIECEEEGKQPVQRQPFADRDLDHLSEDKDSVNYDDEVNCDGFEKERMNDSIMQRTTKATDMGAAMDNDDDGEQATDSRPPGDQKIIEAESGPLYDMQVAVADRVFMARLADMSERPEDCAEFVIDLFRKKDVQMVKVPGEQDPQNADFTKAERNLVHVAIKKIIGPKRVLCRIIRTVLENPKYRRYTKRLHAYIQKTKEEITTEANTFTDMLHSYCIDRQGNGQESEVFFLTLVADLQRYIAEQTPPGQRLKDLKISACATYERAQRKASRLNYASPVKMSHDLHFANFVFDFMDNIEKAIKICEQSVLMCQAVLHTVDEDTYVEATHIMDLLKENIAIWRGQDPAEVGRSADFR